MEHRQDMTQALQMAALAHDLRTPMCIAAGAAQMALSAEGKDVSVQLKQILAAIRAMDGMIASASEELQKWCFTGREICSELEAMCMPRAQEKEQHVHIDVSALEEGAFSLDYGALVRVLVNLLSNAMKYTPAGGEITLRAQVLRLPWRGKTLWLRFVVADNGMGMKRSFMRRMYLPHARAQESAQLPGEGLGLATVKKLIRQMGGFIRVRSEWGKGTVFVIAIPAVQHEKKRPG